MNVENTCHQQAGLRYGGEGSLTSPVTLETKKIGQAFSFTKPLASSLAMPPSFTKTGVLRQPGERRILPSCFNVCSKTWRGVMSTLVTTQTTGTERAKATERCSMEEIASD